MEEGATSGHLPQEAAQFLSQVWDKFRGLQGRVESLEQRSQRGAAQVSV